MTEPRETHDDARHIVFRTVEYEKMQNMACCAEQTGGLAGKVPRHAGSRFGEQAFYESVPAEVRG